MIEKDTEREGEGDTYSRAMMVQIVNEYHIHDSTRKAVMVILDLEGTLSSSSSRRVLV